MSQSGEEPNGEREREREEGLTDKDRGMRENKTRERR